MSAQGQKDVGKLVAVVVTHNRLPHLKRTVAALLAAPDDVLQALIVVDNASGDETADWLAAQSDPRLTVLTSPCNLGGAGGFERGLSHARDVLQADWTVVMDDDARPAPGALAAFRAADRGSWDIIAAAVYTPDGALCPINRPTRNPFASVAHLRGFLRRERRTALHFDAADYADPAPQPADVASFVGLFLSRRALHEGGLPDRRLVYAEDAVYTLSLTRKGLRLGFLPQIRFEHEWSTFSGSDRGFQQDWKVYYYHRNLLMLYRQAVWPWVFWPAFAGFLLPRWLLRAGRQSRSAIGPMLRAMRDGLTGTLPEPPYGPFYRDTGSDRAN